MNSFITSKSNGGPPPVQTRRENKNATLTAGDPSFVRLKRKEKWSDRE